MNMNVDPHSLKARVAAAAVHEVPDGCVLGVGTGSTVDLFIDALATAGKPLAAAVASSERTRLRLESHGYTVIELHDVSEPLALYVDGADEIDASLCMIKGGGAALTREKIVASASERFVCIVDESKCVEVMGRFPLPIEVIAMALRPVTWALESMGGRPVLRAGVLTDNGHPILDVHGLSLVNPLDWEDRLNAIPGVVTNGIFARQRASVALVAGSGGVKRLTPQ
jgi:ribose 5-phosphate isomerase A